MTPQGGTKGGGAASFAVTGRSYVFARGVVAGTMAGFGYIESHDPPERALEAARRQSWPDGVELGVAPVLNVYAVEKWVSAGA